MSNEVSEIFVISGFLGAGKTTLIQKLLAEAFSGEQVVLIENDFGEVSVDAALLQSAKVEVTEINSGCICCSLTGDFVQALDELLDRFPKNKLLIEPSGVGKLSDIVKACSDPRIQSRAAIKAKITVVDVKRCQMYLENFGEFFEDQIAHADVAVFSRTEAFPDRVDQAYELVKELNAHAWVLSQPWEQLTANQILFTEHELDHDHEHEQACSSGHGDHHHEHDYDHHEHGPDCGCHHSDHHHEHHDHHHNHDHHEHHEHGPDCGCHHHTAEEVFDTVTIHTDLLFSVDGLKEKIALLEEQEKGMILRAKGIVRDAGGYINLQYLPGDLRITRCDTAGGLLCFIGQNLDRQELVNLFSGE